MRLVHFAIFGIVCVIILTSGCVQNEMPAAETESGDDSLPVEENEGVVDDVGAPSEVEAGPIAMPDSVRNNCIGFLIGDPAETMTISRIGGAWARPHPGPFSWGYIETSKGVYDFSQTDSWVRKTQENGVALLVTFWPFADWDQDGCKPAECDAGQESIFYPRDEGFTDDKKGDLMGGEPEKDFIESFVPRWRCTPCNFSDYKNFLKKLVDRYDGDGKNDMPGLTMPILYWEVSNEPDMQHGFHTFFIGTPGEYTQILEASYEAIKEECPECMVVQGGAAGIDDDMITFWDGVFKAKGGNHFDIANIHYINYGDISTLNVKRFRQLMDDNGVGKPIWVTEVGLEDENDVVPSLIGAIGAGAEKVFLTQFHFMTSKDEKTEKTMGTYSEVFEGIAQNCESVKQEAVETAGDVEEEPKSSLSMDAYVSLSSHPWPTFHANNQRTGLSPYDTSQVDGTILWSYDTGNGIESSAAISKDGMIYFGSHDGYLYALDVDGNFKWKASLGTPVEKDHYGHMISTASSPAIADDGTIYIVSMEQYLFAFSPSGEELWRFPIGVSFDTWASPAVGSDGTIYITSTQPKEGVYAVNPDGTRKWLYSGDESNMFNSPSIGADGTIYVGIPTNPTRNEVIAIKPSGSKKWSLRTSLFLESSLAIADDGTIYVGSFVDGDTGASLYAVKDGREVWEFETQTKEVMSTPAIGSDGTIYMGDYRDDGSSLHALNPDGTEKWSFPVGGSISSSPAIGSDGTVYFGVSSPGDDPCFYALNPDGTVKWSLTSMASFSASPAIGADGTIYIGAWDGKFYAIG